MIGLSESGQGAMSPRAADASLLHLSVQEAVLHAQVVALLFLLVCVEEDSVRTAARQLCKGERAARRVHVRLFLPKEAALFASPSWLPCSGAFQLLLTGIVGEATAST